MVGERRMTRAAAAGFGLAGLVVVLDQLVKSWILYGLNLPSRGHVELSPVFDLTMVWNQGVSFGLFQAGSEPARWFLILFSLGVAGGLGAWLLKVERGLTATALGLVIGGAVGNVIDRARFGAVADFLDFSGMYFPWVFNVADAAISVGVGFLLLDLVLDGRRAPAAGEPGDG